MEEGFRLYKYRNTEEPLYNLTFCGLSIPFCELIFILPTLYFIYNIHLSFHEPSIVLMKSDSADKYKTAENIL